MKKLKGWEGKPMTKLEELEREASNFRDKGDYEAQYEYLAAFAADQLKAKDAEITRLKAERDELRETNRELNRRNQSLNVELNRQTDRKQWHGYFKAALSLFGKAETRAESAEAKLKQIRELIVQQRDKYRRELDPKTHALDDLLRALDAMEKK